MTSKEETKKRIAKKFAKLSDEISKVDLGDTPSGKRIKSKLAKLDSLVKEVISSDSDEIKDEDRKHFSILSKSMEQNGGFCSWFFYLIQQKCDLSFEQEEQIAEFLTDDQVYSIAKYRLKGERLETTNVQELRSELPSSDFSLLRDMYVLSCDGERYDTFNTKIHPDIIFSDEQKIEFLNILDKEQLESLQSGVSYND